MSSELSKSAQSGPMTVRYWYVCHDSKRPDGGIVNCEPLSQSFNVPQKAEALLERIRGKHPGAYICEAARFFNKARAGDAELMAELIAKLH